MAGPHPVVGVAAELSDAGRRSANKADVAEYAENKEEVLVAVIESLYAGLQSDSVLNSFCLKGIGILIDNTLAVLFCHGSGVVTLENCSSNVLHVFKEAYGKAGICQLLCAAQSPETILKIVVLYAAVLLDIAIATVVVGKKKAIVRNQFSGTAGAKEYDGILQRGLVNAVNIFCGKFEALGLHVPYPLGNKCRKPHSFVCAGRSQEGGKGQDRY